MMRFCFLFLMMMAWSAHDSWAQDSGSKVAAKISSAPKKKRKMGVQHVNGVQSIDVTGGIMRYGNRYSLGYVRYFSNKVYGKAQLYYGMGTHEASGLKFTRMGLNMYAAYNLFHVKEKLYVNATGGLVVENDQVTSGQQDLGLNIPSTMKYGVMGGMETEFFITRKWVFILNFNQDLVTNGNFGSTKYAAQGGLRFNF